jgi:hypothetical protein
LASTPSIFASLDPLALLKLVFLVASPARDGVIGAQALQAIRPATMRGYRHFGASANVDVPSKVISEEDTGHHGVMSYAAPRAVLVHPGYRAKQPLRVLFGYLASDDVRKNWWSLLLLPPPLVGVIWLTALGALDLLTDLVMLVVGLPVKIVFANRWTIRVSRGSLVAEVTIRGFRRAVSTRRDIATLLRTGVGDDDLVEELTRRSTRG